MKLIIMLCEKTKDLFFLITKRQPITHRVEKMRFYRNLAQFENMDAARPAESDVYKPELVALSSLHRARA